MKIHFPDENLGWVVAALCHRSAQLAAEVASIPEESWKNAPTFYARAKVSMEHEASWLLVLADDIDPKFQHHPRPVKGEEKK